MKKILCFILCIVTVLSLTACGILSDEPDTTDPTTSTKPTENSGDITKPSDSTNPTIPSNGDEYGEKTVEYAAQQFIKNLIEAKYDVALRYFNVPAETPYFTANDVEWYLPRSNYADVENIKYEKYTITVEANKKNSESATCVVTVKDANSEKNKIFNLNMVMDNTNKWGVQDNDFYLEEYYVVAPGGNAILTVNGIDASDDYEDKYGSYKYRALYKLNYVGKSEKLIAVSSDNFESYEEKIYPVQNTQDNPQNIFVEDENQVALDYLKSTWAEVYQAVLDKTPYSNMVHLLSPQADPALAQIMMTGVDIMRKGGTNHSFKIVEMSFCTNDDWKSHWLADNKLCVCFNYTLNWVEDLSYASPKSRTMKYFDKIVLHYDGTNFTIDSLSSENAFFTKYDSYTQKVM